MRDGMDKALAVLGCAFLVGVLCALSWHGESAPTGWDPGAQGTGVAGDALAREIDRFHSAWRNHDQRTNHAEGARFNP